MPMPPLAPLALTHRAVAVVQQVVVPAIVALHLPRDALLGSCNRQNPPHEQQEKSMKQASPLEDYIYIVTFFPPMFFLRLPNHAGFQASFALLLRDNR